MKKVWIAILVLSLGGNLAMAWVAYKALNYRSNINYWLDKYMHVVDEFSQRDVYAGANTRLVSDTIVPGRMVFFGTQVTRRWPVQEYFADYDAINRGVDSQRVAGFLLRFRPDVIDLMPEAVVIEVSSYNFRPNTTVAEVQDYVASMADLAQYHGIRPILTTTIPPRTDMAIEDFPEYSVRDSVVQFNSWLRDFSSRRGVQMADFASILSENGYLRSEVAMTEVDINDRGYDLISAELRGILAHQPEP